MSTYRRAYLKGGCYFFTAVTYKRIPILTTPENIKRLRNAFSYVKEKMPFSLDAIVILPDHLHCIWTLPESDDDFSTRWKLLKGYFSKGIDVNANFDGSKNIWQPRFWEHLIRDEADFQKHMDYIHYNPVKHGYVDKPCDWEYSSFLKLIKRGYYDPGWGETSQWSVIDLGFE